MDEFISPAERQNRAYQFEKLKQTYQMSVSEYAKEFTRLSKYAPRLVPDEAARVDRFRAGMIPPLYNVLLSGDFPTLTKIVDGAKFWETKNKEVWVERDRKRKMRSGQSSKGKSEGASVQVTSHNQNRGGQRRGQSQVTLVQSTPAATQGSVKPVCKVCGKGQSGQCRYFLHSLLPVWASRAYIQELPSEGCSAACSPSTPAYSTGRETCWERCG